MSSLPALHGEHIGTISRKAHSKLMVWVANLQKVCSKLRMWVILWVHCEVTKCHQNELSVSFNVSSQRLSCELKFSTGKLSGIELIGHGVSSQIKFQIVSNCNEVVFMPGQSYIIYKKEVDSSIYFTRGHSKLLRSNYICYYSIFWEQPLLSTKSLKRDI